ncbi:MAG TPA: glycosyltransferase, partial [Thermoplasmata archaeon]|nr:glycosyltransferase [Thermoplasmata archaeon]
TVLSFPPVIGTELGPAVTQGAPDPPGDPAPRSGLSVVSRLLWPGVGRMAIEEARRLPASLLVYRESGKPVPYDLTGIPYRYLRRRGQAGRWTPILSYVTQRFNPGRGPDATVDLDLILSASREVQGPALFHDQFAGLTGWIRKLRSGYPYALYLHETALGDPTGGVMSTRSRWANAAVRRFDRSVLRGARLVLTNSVTNQRLLAAEGINAEVLYPGCEPDPSLSAPREPIALATSVWEPTRQMEFYAELARRTKARVVLAGMWARPEDLDAFRRRFGTRPETTGPIVEADLVRLSRRASVYVRFGFGERGPGQGGIQAMGFGLPVIANRELAIAEIIEDGVDGFVVGTAAEAAERIDGLLDDPAALRRMGAAAWAKSQTLSWTAHADRLRMLLRRAGIDPGD